MDLKLIRKYFRNDCVIGELYVDNNFRCFTLEDQNRDLVSTMTLSEIAAIKVPAKTAIPEGKYEIIVSFSNRFKKPLPLLLDVPGYAGVRIHPGNTHADTEGCILVGRKKNSNSISESRIAFNDLFHTIEEARKKEKIFLEISK